MKGKLEILILNKSLMQEMLKVLVNFIMKYYC